MARIVIKPGVKATIAPGVKIGTFAKTESGGKIVMDDSSIKLGPNATIGKMYDSSGEGSHISARRAAVETHQDAQPRPGFFARVASEVTVKVAVSLIIAAIGGVASVAWLYLK
jgi:hypothetical protein